MPVIGSCSGPAVGLGQRLARVAVGLADLVEQPLEGQPHVGDDRVAHRRPRRLVGVGGDRDQRRALGQQRAGDVRVVGEDRGADDEDQVAAGERLGDRADRRRQHAAEVRMALGEAEPPAAGGRDREHRQALALGERDAASQAPLASMSGPATSTGFEAASSRRASSATASGSPTARAAGPALDRRPGVVVVDLGVPVVHRDRDEGRALRRQRRQVGGPGERQRDVLGARRLVAPLDQRMRHPGRVAVGQVRLHRDQRAAPAGRR